MVLEPPVPLVYDESESSITKETESEDIVPHQRPAIWKCLKCGVETSAPMKFCTTCYKVSKHHSYKEKCFFNIHKFHFRRGSGTSPLDQENGGNWTKKLLAIWR